MTVTLKEFAGGAQATTLSSGITNSATSLIVADGSSFPTGATAPFVIVIGRGTAAEEKILVTSRSGNNLTITTRGYDGSAAAAHSAGDAVEHCLDATTVSEANTAAVNTIGKITTLGDLLVGSAAGLLKRLGVGTARQNLQVNAGGTDLGWAASMQSLLTAAGDIIYASGANTPARLAKDTDGKVLTLVSGLPAWVASTFVGARAYRTTTQSFATSTFTALALTTESYDTDAIHDTGANTDRFVVPAAKGGKYLVTAYADLSTVSKAILVIYKNGADAGVGLHDQVQAITGGANVQLQVSGVYDLSAGDYLSAYMWSDHATPSCFDAAVSFSKIG